MDVSAPAFQCLRCRTPISVDQLRERMKNPPGQCDECGGIAILQADEGQRMKEIAAEIDVPVVDIDIDRFRRPGQGGDGA